MNNVQIVFTVYTSPATQLSGEALHVCQGSKVMEAHGEK
jgi:hypothetical protein